MSEPIRAFRLTSIPTGWVSEAIYFIEQSPTEADIYVTGIDAVPRRVAQGNDGLSAYQIALERGFSGSENDWMESLNGLDGARWIEVVLSEDFNVAQNPTKIPGFNFKPEPDSVYLIDAWLMVRTSLITGGIRPGVVWPESDVIDGWAYVEVGSGTTSNTVANIPVNSNSGAATGNHVDTSSSWRARVEAMVKTGPSPFGEFAVTVASENGSTTGTVRAGSVMRIKKIET